MPAWATPVWGFAGEPNTEPSEATLDAALDYEDTEPSDGPTDHEAPDASGDSEDSEGRSDAERLVESGFARAEQDQRAQAAEE